MRGLARGFVGLAAALFGRRRFRVMIVLCLGTAWLSMEVYRDLVVRDVAVAVVDRDNSSLSRTLRTFLSAPREIRLVSPEIASVEEAERLLTRGEIGAVVLIPSGFSREVKHGRQARLVVAIDMSNLLVGKNVSKAIAKASAALSAGVQLTLVKKLGERKERALSRVLPVALTENLSFNPASNYGIYVIPGLLFFLQHILVLVLAATVYADPKGPASLPERLGALAAIFFFSVALGLLLLYGFLLRVEIAPASGFLAVLVPLMLFVAVDLALAAAIARLVPHRLVALEATVLVAMLSLMFSGLTWPLDMFPEPLREVARFIPFTPFAQSTRLFLHYDVELSDLREPLLLLGLQAAVFVGAAALGTALRAAWAAIRQRRAA
jgi:ABC-2 type transport system permease protein